VLGQLLVASGDIDEEDLAAALEEQRGTRERLGQILVRRGLAPEALARALAAQLRLPYAEAPLRPRPDALREVDRALALRHRVVALELSERSLRVALADPLDAAALDDLRFQTGRRVEPVVATPAAVDQALVAGYGVAAIEAVRSTISRSLPGPVRRGAAQASSPGRGAGAVEERHARGAAARTYPSWPAYDDGATDEVGALRRASEAPPVVALVDLILARAVAVGASDVHVEPGRCGLRVRARVDGLLRELLELPEQVSGAVVSRLKIMAGLDISIKRRPQDGRGSIRVEGRELGLRVSTLPAQGGEKVVLRLLDPENTGLGLDALGLGASVRAGLERLLGRGHGVVLVTGPTGSGKTTTLYAALAGLDRDRRNVITLEDPVEYRLPGLTQVQVHRRAGLTFAAALRAVLRQDPDIIMVGEMRDRETAEIGMAAALTGHLVLSTLHTNDAPGAVTRLVEMGVPRYLVAGALIGVLAQRLVRRLCARCRVERDATPDEALDLGLTAGARRARIHAPRGCEGCGGTGYSGRIGIFELLTVDARIRSLILRGASTDAIRDAARSAGTRPLGVDAREKVLAGLTSLDEVRPLLMLLDDEAPLCPECGTGVRHDFSVCPGCGRALRARCACGRWLEEGWRCCPGCGAARANPAK